MTEGTVSRWLKQVGDSVEADEPLLEVSTDKVDTEIPSPTSGTLLEIRVAEDETVEVGAVLAVVGEAGARAAPAEAPRRNPAPEPDTRSRAGQPPARARAGQARKPASRHRSPHPHRSRRAAKAATPQPEQHGRAAAASATPPTPVASDSDAGYVTPLVRKLAKEHGVDLAVGAPAPASAAASASRTCWPRPKTPRRRPRRPSRRRRSRPPPAAPAAPAAAGAAGRPSTSSLRGTTEKMSRLRKTIARRMVESLQVSAQLTATVEVDLTAISRIRARHKDDFKPREGASLSYLPFITKAAIEALKVYPKVNATIDTEAGEVNYPTPSTSGSRSTPRRACSSR